MLTSALCTEPFDEFEQAFLEVGRRNEELKRKLSQALEMVDGELAVEARSTLTHSK